VKAREAKIPLSAKPRLSEAANGVVKLFEAWGKPAKAGEWRKKLGLKPDLPADVFAH
jgi:hypothetical protein